MNRFVVLPLIGRALLAVGFSTAALADQKFPNRLNQSAQPWPEAVVIIKSRPVGEPEATEANIVLKPPIFAERNSLGAKPTGAVRSRVSRAKKVRVNSRRMSSPSWRDKVWAER